MNVTKYRNRRLASRNMKHLRGLKFKGKISQCEMHLVACSCSAGTLARLFPCLFFLGPGERVGTMQLGSLGGQGLPCRLPRCLFSGHINRKQPAPPSLHFVVLGVVVVVVVVCRSCDCVATNAVPPESYDPFLAILAACVHRAWGIHAFWLWFTRGDIILAKSNHLRDFLADRTGSIFVYNGGRASPRGRNHDRLHSERKLGSFAEWNDPLTISFERKESAQVEVAFPEDCLIHFARGNRAFNLIKASSRNKRKDQNLSDNPI